MSRRRELRLIPPTMLSLAHLLCFPRLGVSPEPTAGCLIDNDNDDNINHCQCSTGSSIHFIYTSKRQGRSLYTMLDHDPEKAAGAASNDTASAQTLHLQTSPSGSDLPRPVEKDAERHLDDGTAAHGSRRTSRDDDNDDDDEDDADEDEDEDDSDVDAIPGRALDRQLSRVSWALLHPGISISSETLC